MTDETTAVGERCGLPGCTDPTCGADPVVARPEFGTEDYWRYAVLFNDVTRAPSSRHMLFSDRNRMADYLWSQGWRRDVRPEDRTP